MSLTCLSLPLDLDKFLQCLQDPCHAVHNPRGYIPLCVAENKLVLDLLMDRFVHCAANGFGDPTVYAYNSNCGMLVSREAVAYFLARRFVVVDSSPSRQSPHVVLTLPDEALRLVSPRHVALAAGCAAILNHVLCLLRNDDNNNNCCCCLIPQPYYAAFDSDLTLLADVTPFGVSQAQAARGPTVDEWQAAYEAARRQGLKPRFVLITNPHNPLGVVYGPDVLRDAVTWARSRQLHVLVDEIYALSTQPPHQFTSVARVLDNQLGNDVHILWAISKDFGASGLRCGVLYSQNETLMAGMERLGVFTCVSGPIQYLIAELLTDDPFVDDFLKQSQQRLRHAYEICTRKLEEMVLPFVPAQAGMFVYVDFSSLLPAKTFAYEQQLSQLLFQYARIVLTPGESQHDDKPGMFRICFAFCPPDVLEMGMERLSRFVAKLRRIDFHQLGDRAFANVLDV